MEQTDGITIHVVSDYVQENWLAFICDVTYARLKQRFSHSILRSKQLYLIYAIYIFLCSSQFFSIDIYIADYISRKQFLEIS